jgi:WD repeat-containing protein 81
MNYNIVSGYFVILADAGKTVLLYNPRISKHLCVSLTCVALQVSDMSVDSVVWLSHRLGPVLTARHLSRNLLRMLTLCYLGQENLSTMPSGGSDSQDTLDTPAISISKGAVFGDQNAVKVLECLASIAS